MNILDLKGKLDSANIDLQYVCFHAPAMEDSDVFCIFQEKGMWITLYAERGAVKDKVLFNSEEKACEHFLNWILEFVPSVCRRD